MPSFKLDYYDRLGKYKKTVDYESNCEGLEGMRDELHKLYWARKLPQVVEKDDWPAYMLVTDESKCTRLVLTPFLEPSTAKLK